MPVSGRKPKPAGQARNRNKPTHDWTEVEDIPFDAPPVELPVMRNEIDKDGQVMTYPIHPRTVEWWADVSTMPHCRLWGPAEWRFAITTALVADALYYGRTAVAGELRQREKVLGTTADARRDLRIKYVQPQPKEAPDAGVTHLDDYRSL